MPGSRFADDVFFVAHFFSLGAIPATTNLCVRAKRKNKLRITLRAAKLAKFLWKLGKACVRIFRASFRDSREAARSLPFDSGNEQDRKRPALGIPELVGFLLHPVSRSETRRRLKQLHANFGQSPLARSGKAGPNSLGERVDLEEATANRQRLNSTEF